MKYIVIIVVIYLCSNLSFSTSKLIGFDMGLVSFQRRSEWIMLKPRGWEQARLLWSSLWTGALWVRPIKLRGNFCPSDPESFEGHWSERDKLWHKTCQGGGP